MGDNRPKGSNKVARELKITLLVGLLTCIPFPILVRSNVRVSFLLSHGIPKTLLLFSASLCEPNVSFAYVCSSLSFLFHLFALPQ